MEKVEKVTLREYGKLRKVGGFNFLSQAAKLEKVKKLRSNFQRRGKVEKSWIIIGK